MNVRSALEEPAVTAGAEVTAGATVEAGLSRHSRALMGTVASIAVPERAVSQDGIVGGLRVSPKGAQEVWARNLTSGGAVAVALFNKGEQPANITVKFSDIGLPALVNAFDLWALTPPCTHEAVFTEEVPPHGTAFARLVPAAEPPTQNCAVKRVVAR